jgi:hypothetical protein
MPKSPPVVTCMYDVMAPATRAGPRSSLTTSTRRTSTVLHKFRDSVPSSAPTERYNITRLVWLSCQHYCLIAMHVLTYGPVRLARLYSRRKVGLRVVESGVSAPQQHLGLMQFAQLTDELLTSRYGGRPTRPTVRWPLLILTVRSLFVAPGGSGISISTSEMV